MNRSPYNSEFPKIEYFIKCYFHMDWDIEGSTDLEVVQSFKRQELIGRLEDVTIEFSKFIELAKQGKVDADKYLASISCMYYYPASNLTGLQWLERIKDELKRP